MHKSFWIRGSALTCWEDYGAPALSNRVEAMGQGKGNWKEKIERGKEGQLLPVFGY